MDCSKYFRRTKTGNFYGTLGGLSCCVFVGKYGGWSFILNDARAGVWFDTCSEAMGEAVRRAFAAPPTPACLKALGLSPPVDRDTLMARYRRLALETHPDHGGTCEMFKRVQAAFESALLLVRGPA